MKNRDTDLTPAGRRKGAHVSYRSPQQLHYFNCPFQKLVKRAYDLSLDRTIDSPFARLAKENDKMWGGGMPDDITIIVARVVKRA
ncbi:hypothetical protein DYB32_004551 [Aphanomyces invadans]|uniref:Protein phosphatase n=1 Tax=Aphanomyces invadans TaxID=157072 RepID=A0A3R6WMB4_9STRA|nr:hypothetical protein DYB32_004551 [Aphanomyces invadans]